MFCNGGKVKEFPNSKFFMEQPRRRVDLENRRSIDEASRESVPQHKARREFGPKVIKIMEVNQSFVNGIVDIFSPENCDFGSRSNCKDEKSD